MTGFVTNDITYTLYVTSWHGKHFDVGKKCDYPHQFVILDYIYMTTTSHNIESMLMQN